MSNSPPPPLQTTAAQQSPADRPQMPATSQGFALSSLHQCEQRVLAHLLGQLNRVRMGLRIDSQTLTESEMEADGLIDKSPSGRSNILTEKGKAVHKELEKHFTTVRKS